VVEQQAPLFDTMEFFPKLTEELLEENRSWLQPTFIDLGGSIHTDQDSPTVSYIAVFAIFTPHPNFPP
jgi:hypothetical protein